MLYFPTPPRDYDPAFFTRVLEAIKTALRGVVPKEEAVERVLLQAPDGSVWKVTVSNTGTLTTTQVPLGG